MHTVLPPTEYHCTEHRTEGQQGRIYVRERPYDYAVKYAQLETSVACLPQEIEFPPDIRLVLCLEGQTHLHIGQQQIRLHADQGACGVLLPVQQAVRGRKIFHRGRQRELVLFFNYRYLADWAAASPRLQTYLRHLQPTYFDLTPLMLQLAQALQHSCMQGDAWQQIYCRNHSQALLAEVLQQLLPPPPTQAQQLRRQRRLEKLMRLLHSEEGENMSVAELAAACHSNPTTLQADFQAHYGSSIVRYVRSMKLERARRVLLAGGSVTAAALTAGYRNPDCFSRAFKQQFGCVPQRLGREPACLADV